jgi:predicted nucleic acid-binding protein
MLLQEGPLLARALDIYERYRLDFADAVAAAHVELEGLPHVISFDGDFDRVPGITRLEP